MTNNDITSFFEYFQKSVKENSFVKLTFSKSRSKNDDLKNVFVKHIEIKQQQLFSFTYRKKFNDITKNLNYDTAVEEINNLINNHFSIVNLISTDKNLELKYNKKNIPKLFFTKSSVEEIPERKHDNIKNRKISLSKKYLYQLGITNENGIIVKNMSDKYRQIEKFVEIIENITKQLNTNKKLSIVDMGSGKGYLTFAVYDYLTNSLNLDVNVRGIETQKKLVDLCNDISISEKFKNLTFEKATIDKIDFSNIDILIALHACDTATDDAIYKGIKTNAKAIVVAPCCHKQIRKQIKNDNILKSITKHGILLERQAEMLTDSIRALILEKYAYKTNVFEFISTEHTGKNLMISAIKTSSNENTEKQQEIDNLKQLFGIDFHYLEKLLSEEDGDWKNQNPICDL